MREKGYGNLCIIECLLKNLLKSWALSVRYALFCLILCFLIYLFKEFPLPPLLPIPSHSCHSLSSSLSSPKSSQGFLPCGKFKFLPLPSRSRKVSIQTD